MTEIVYVFANPAMSDYIKIGRTTRDNLEQRLNALSNHSGVPAPFVCLYAAEVADAQRVEDAVHRAFGVDRPNPRREFFTTPPDRIITLLEAFAVEDASNSVQNMLDEISFAEDKSAQSRVSSISERRSRLKFSEVGIQPGAELVFVRDPAKKCRVIDDKKVEYEGEPLALSALATKLLYGYASPVRVQGALYFKYGDELLRDLRDRLESEGET